MFSKGDIFIKSFLVTDEKIRQFSEVSEDMNPIHLDEDFAKTSIFKGKIAHGMLGVSFISAVLGNDITGTIYLEQNVKFLKPVRPGDEIYVTVEILDIDSKNRAKIRTDCYVDDTMVIKGEAKVLLPA